MCVDCHKRANQYAFWIHEKISGTKGKPVKLYEDKVVSSVQHTAITVTEMLPCPPPFLTLDDGAIKCQSLFQHGQSFNKRRSVSIISCCSRRILCNTAERLSKTAAQPYQKITVKYRIQYSLSDLPPCATAVCLTNSRKTFTHSAKTLVSRDETSARVLDQLFRV